MKNKTILITGGSDGIGKETAKRLAEMGANVVIVGRNPAKTEAAAQEIQQETGASVDVLIADLSDLNQVKRLAGEVRSQYPQLNILINNAGAIFLSRGETVDGYERTFALNHLSYFLLTDLLLDTLKKNTPARIINVASGAHYPGVIYFDDLMFTKRYRFRKVYSQSKLANVMFTYALARRLEGIGVTVNSLHPGFVRSNFASGNGRLAKIIRPIAFRSAITVEQGAETTIYLASSDEVEGISGKYYTLLKEKRSSDLSYDEEAQEKLWAMSEDLINRVVN